MNRVLGFNCLGILASGLSIWILGWLWYAIIFNAPWLAANNYTVEALATGEEQFLLYVGGALVSLLLAFSQGKAMVAFGAETALAAVKVGLGIGLFIATPIVATYLIYSVDHNWTLFAIDASYMVLSFCLAGLIFTRFK